MPYWQLSASDIASDGIKLPRKALKGQQTLQERGTEQEATFVMDSTLFFLSSYQTPRFEMMRFPERQRKNVLSHSHEIQLLVTWMLPLV